MKFTDPMLINLNEFIDVLNDTTPTTSIKNSIIELKDKLEIKLSLPGYDKKNIDVESQNGEIVISYKTNDDDDNDDDIVSFSGYDLSPQDFIKSFKINDDFNVNQIKAEYINGILTITIPKDHEKIKSRKIEIS